MRIALVTEYYYPHLGGVTEHVHNLAKYLISAGHEPIVVTAHMRGGQHPDEPFVRRVGTSRVIYSNGSFARISSGWNLRAQMRELFRNERIDVAHLHGPVVPTLGLVAQDAADDLGIPVVGTFHSWFPRSVLFSLFKKPVQKRMERYAAAIAVSTPVVDAHSRYFDTRWRIIPNGVDTDMFHPNGRESYPDDRPLKLLFLGRLDPRNGLDTLLDAMPSILAQKPDAQLIVAGDGPLRPVYERMAQPVRDSVTFLGHVNGDRPVHYGTADMYLCPTTKASFGITLLEAMACGTPLIVSDITGFRELVDGGQEAMLVPKANPAAWADATLQLAADRARRREMSAAGREKSLRFSWPVVAQQIIEVYEEVLRK